MEGEELKVESTELKVESGGGVSGWNIADKRNRIYAKFDSRGRAMAIEHYERVFKKSVDEK